MQGIFQLVVNFLQGSQDWYLFDKQIYMAEERHTDETSTEDY
ncbi:MULTISPECIES: hypothetical protein [Aerosakkonema]